VNSVVIAVCLAVFQLKLRKYGKISKECQRLMINRGQDGKTSQQS